MRLLRYFILPIFLLTACLPAAAQPTATVSFTTSPKASDTPTPLPTATATIALSPTVGPSATPSPTPIPPKVVLISIDGLRPDALLQANAPNLLGLAQRGAWTWTAQTVYPSVTLVAHASMLSGLTPEQHGLTWNDYTPSRTLTFTTVFSLAHAAGLRTVLVTGKEKFAHFNLPGTVDAYTFVRNGDQGVADEAIVQAQAGFDLMFVHFPNTDYFGHSVGWLSEAQINGIGRTDEAVGRLLAALPANTVVIVSADHGGHGTAHGSRSPEDMTIPWVIAGPGIRANHQLATPVTTLDTTPTIAYLLHLPLPADVTGQPVLEALDK